MNEYTIKMTVEVPVSGKTFEEALVIAESLKRSLQNVQLTDVHQEYDIHPLHIDAVEVFSVERRVLAHGGEGQNA